MAGGITTMLLAGATLLLGPERLDLGEDALAELVPRASERERRMGVQALEPAAARLASDPGLELRSDAALLFVAALGAGPQLRVLAREPAPALDAPGRLDAGELRDELRAGEPERGRERLARFVEGRLLGYRGPAERAADDDVAEGPRRAADLAFDDLAVIHPGWPCRE